MEQSQRPTFLLGHSLGGLIAIEYVLREAPELSGLIVSNPLLAPARLSLVVRAAAAVLAHLAPSVAVKTGSRTPPRFRAIRPSSRYCWTTAGSREIAAASRPVLTATLGARWASTAAAARTTSDSRAGASSGLLTMRPLSSGASRRTYSIAISPPRL